MTRPSFLTSTTAIGFLLTVAASLSYAAVTKNTDLMMKLVEMIVPAYLMNKGFQMGKNGQEPPKP